MEKIPNEILLKIFSYLEVQDLGRCAMASKRFHEMAYERRLWQKLPINLFYKEVPVGFVQHIMKHEIAYINLQWARIIGDSVHFTQQKSLKYLILDFHPQNGREVKKNLLASCTQLEKLSCHHIKYENDLDDIFQCIEQNSGSLKCLQLRMNNFNLDVNTTKFPTAISKCNKLEELGLRNWDFEIDRMNVMKNLPQNLKKLYIYTLPLTIEELKVLVATCRQLEELFLFLNCCEDSTCHHFDEVITILVGSSLSGTLVNLSLIMERINVHEQFSSKCLELAKMKQLKKIELISKGEEEFHSGENEAKDILRKNLPHLTIVEDKTGKLF